MELQTSSAGEQMSQLQDLLNSERSKFAQAMEERQRQIESETARDNGEAEKAVVDELAELKKLLGTTNSEVLMFLYLTGAFVSLTLFLYSCKNPGQNFRALKIVTALKWRI